jgi:excisionase family DNA binding protein
MTNQGRRDRQRGLATKALLSIEETAIVLGETRSTLYRAVRAGTLPLPVYVIGGRMRVPRRAVERLVAGLAPVGDDAGEGDRQEAEPRSSVSSRRRRRPTCSAARRSSSGTESV